MKKLIEYLERLEEASIHYMLEHNREDAIMVTVAVPGERWEIEFFPDDSVEVEVFRSSGEIKDESELSVLFERFAD